MLQITRVSASQSLQRSRCRRIYHTCYRFLPLSAPGVAGAGKLAAAGKDEEGGEDKFLQNLLLLHDAPKIGMKNDGNGAEKRRPAQRK